MLEDNPLRVNAAQNNAHNRPGATHKIDHLVDDDFYNGVNDDVSKAGLDPKEHYFVYGAAEGRDPNQYFSTTAYLAVNTDVRAAAINPLQHYQDNGFREGRDPGANFDNELYLSHNLDVKNAGMNPLEHFLKYGQAEGRETYKAVGNSASIEAHHGFDAEYYLLANPDVAKAAIAAGGDSFEFAHRHFDNFGWHEGRNPNAIFDTAGYLSAYADVKAAGVNPLDHYVQFGAHEGRDASAKFDTSSYYSHYHDVQTSNLDPMRHFLEYGALEGRSGFNDGIFS